jgi:hypothetical protein
MPASGKQESLTFVKKLQPSTLTLARMQCTFPAVPRFTITESRRIIMKRGIFTSLALLALWGTGLNFASAQFGGLGQAPPRVRPTVSPFINLGQGGAGAFYGIIKPQLDANRSINDLQQGLNRLNPDGSLRGQIDAGSVNALGGLQTGHSATFMNYSHYFPLVPPGGSGTAGNLGIGTGLGGYNPSLGGGFGLGNTGFNSGGGGFGLGNTGGRTFFGGNLNQSLIRP